MTTKIQLRRGLKQELPPLDSGEVGYCTDTEELFIGSESGNKRMTFDATKYADYDTQLADIDTEKANKSDLNVTNATVAIKANQNDVRLKAEKLTQYDMSAEFLQQMAGTTPVNAVVEKTSIFDIGINKFNKAKATFGKYLNTANGQEISLVDYYISEFIEVEPNMQYRVTEGDYFGFYDQDKIYISGASFADPRYAVSPSNAKYMRFSFYKNFYATNMLTKASEYPSVYTPFQYVLKTGTAKGFEKIVATNVVDKSITPKSCSFIDEIFGINLFNKADFTDNYFVWTDGILTANTQYAVSGYIPVKPNYPYTHNSGGTVCCFYTDKHEFISGVNSSSVTTPTNAAYIRWTIDKTVKTVDQYMVVKGTALPTSYVSYEEPKEMLSIYIPKANVVGIDTRQWEGKKAVAIGDSITEWSYADENGINFNYRDIVLSNLKLDSYKMCGEHGKKMHEITSIMAYSSTTEAHIQAADLITVFLGQNDVSTPLGTINDLASSDGTSFYGSTKGLIQYLLGLNPKCTLAFITPTPSAGTETTLRVRSDAIKQVCELYSVPVLDLIRMSNFNSYNYSYFYTDATVHPNGIGQKRIGRIIASFLENL